MLLLILSNWYYYTDTVTVFPLIFPVTSVIKLELFAFLKAKSSNFFSELFWSSFSHEVIIATDKKKKNIFFMVIIFVPPYGFRSRPVFFRGLWSPLNWSIFHLSAFSASVGSLVRIILFYNFLNLPITRL